MELLPSVVWTSQSTPAQCMLAHFTRLGPCAKTQSVTLTHFFVAQSQSVLQLLGIFHKICGFPVSSGVFMENLGFVRLWSNFINVCCITVFSIHEYSSFIGVMCRVSTVDQGKA